MGERPTWKPTVRLESFQDTCLQWSRSPPTGISCPSAHRNSIVFPSSFTQFQFFSLMSTLSVFESVNFLLTWSFHLQTSLWSFRRSSRTSFSLQNFYINSQHKTRWARHGHRVSHVTQFAREWCLGRPKQWILTLRYRAWRMHSELTCDRLDCLISRLTRILSFWGGFVWVE